MHQCYEYVEYNVEPKIAKISILLTSDVIGLEPATCYMYLVCGVTDTKRNTHKMWFGNGKSLLFIVKSNSQRDTLYKHRSIVHVCQHMINYLSKWLSKQKKCGHRNYLLSKMAQNAILKLDRGRDECKLVSRCCSVTCIRSSCPTFNCW